MCGLAGIVGSGRPVSPEVLAAMDERWNRLAAGRGRTVNVWRLVNLELWVQQIIDHSSSVSDVAA